MVLVLDDMVNGAEVTTTGLIGEAIERLEKLGLAVSPPVEDRRVGWDVWRKWARWGCNDFRARGKPQPIGLCGRVRSRRLEARLEDMVIESGVNLRLHSWFSEPIVENGRIQGRRRGDQGRPTGAAGGDRGRRYRRSRRRRARRRPARRRRVHGDDGVQARQRRHRRRASLRVRASRGVRCSRSPAKRLLGGAWDSWWLKTPLPGSSGAIALT
jgi:hypothetical protein